MPARASWIAKALVAALLCGAWGTSQARELYRENFRRLPLGAEKGVVPAGRGGPGWSQSTPAISLSAPVSFGGVRRGVVSFDLRRVATPDPARRGTVFELLNSDGKRLFRMMIAWSSSLAPSRPEVVFMGGDSDFNRNSLGLWSPLILLDREIKPEQAVHIDLAWDDGQKEYGLYVDGAPVNARPGTYDPVQGAFVRDVRERENEQNRNLGKPALFREEPFSYFLSRARTVVIGNYDSPKRPATRERALLSNAVVDNFVITVDEPAEELHTAQHDVRDLKGTYANGSVELTWAPPEIHGIDQQYIVYRRAGEGNARFERLTAESVRDLRFVDTTAVAGQTYRYSVTSVYGDLKGGYLEGQYPPEVGVTVVPLAVASVAAESAVYGAGEEIVVTLRGTPDASATFALDGVTAAPATMVEVDDGMYVGKVAVPAGLNLAAAKLTGTLTLAGEAVAAEGAPVRIDSIPPEAAGPVLAGAPWAGEVEVAWDPSPSADVAHYAVYRGAGVDPVATGEPLAVTREPRLLDTAVTPGLTYAYAVVSVDRAGNAGPASAVARATAVGGSGPKLASVAAEPADRTLRPGAVVTLTVTGQSGGTVSADLGTLAQGLALAEQGRTGLYLGTYAVKAEDVAATKGLHQLVARLTDAVGETSALAGPRVAVVGQDGLNDQTPPALASVAHDGFRVAGLSGRLVAGDVVAVTAAGEPAGAATFTVPGVVKGVAMKETAPGAYTGAFTVPWGAAGADLPVVATLADENGNEASARAERGLTFDTRLRLTVGADKPLLPADRKSATRLTAKVENANGVAVEGHELALTLSTTEEYTGVVGGGSVGGRTATKDDVDDVEVKWGGVTNAFGEMSADYTAGFAAKTALVVAKDLATGDVGVGWLHTYVASTVAIELIPRTSKGAEDQAVLRMSADPSKLTADGRSTSRIKLWLTDRSGAALAGVKIAFSLGNQNGRLRVLQATTDAKGVAEAEYRAGTAIGTVTVTAAAADFGVTGSVQIVLMSDAPAKIDLVASAARLIANGSDTATLSIAVTDIHDNPNSQVPVTFAVLQGSGSVRQPALLTDRNGEASAEFVAGTRPGTVIVEARHTSRPPSEPELRRIHGTVFVPRWYERQERDRIKVGEWLVKPGDEVEKGETLVTLETRLGTQTLAAPAKGVFVREVRHERDAVELGDTVGYVEVDPEVWRNEYSK